MKQVLIADDEPHLRRLVQETLQPGGFELLVAADGDDAWQQIQRHRPQVVLLDIQMPGRTGLEVIACVRADPSLAETRIILLSARSQHTDIDNGIAAGADRYLVKPFSPLQLIAAVEDALAAA